MQIDDIHMRWVRCSNGHGAQNAKFDIQCYDLQLVACMLFEPLITSCIMFLN
jgi:hypothetical protein